MLVSAFKIDAASADTSFLSFIGYPPVLDAIVTLFREEHNYYKIQRELQKTGACDVEFELLHRISNYILRR